MHQCLACIYASKFGPTPLALPARLPILSLALVDVGAVPDGHERGQLDGRVDVAAGFDARVRRFTHDDGLSIFRLT